MDYRLLSLGLFSVMTGCARDGSNGEDARLSNALASLMATAEVSAREGADSARARTMADSALAAAGWTRQEFDAARAALERAPERWRVVTEDAAKLLEQRLAGPGR